MGKWRIIALVIASIIVATVLILWFVPVMQVTHAQQEPYTTTETYTEKEPYTTTETYTEKEPYTTTETYYETEPSVKNQNIQYSVIKSWFDGWGFWDFKGDGGDLFVKIQNLDSTNGGTFNVTYYITLSGGGTANRYASKYIGPGQIVDIQATYAGAGIVRFTYSITPPTKQVTEYQQVAKTREVTQFRDVVKTRNVTQVRDVEKTREVTQVRNVEKTREVVKIRDVKKHETVSVFKYLFD